MNCVENLKLKVSALTGERDQILRSIESIATKVVGLRDQKDDHKKAQQIIRDVSLQTQKQLEFKVSSLVSTCLSTVFEDPYEFHLEFTERRNKTEGDIFFTRGDAVIDPMEQSGGGVLDVASFALRVVGWKLSRKNLRPVFILDEPFKFLNRDRQPKAGQMLVEVSQKLGVQIIMDSHQRDIIARCDKVFEVTMRDRVSKIMEIEA